MPMGVALRLLALAVFAPAQAWAQTAPPADSPGAATAPDEVEALEAQVRELLRSQRFYDAEPLAARLLGLREQQLGADAPDTINAAAWLAAVFRNQRRYGEAEPLLNRVLAWLEQNEGRDAPGLRPTVASLVQLYEGQALADRARTEALYRRALDLTERVLGADDIDTYSAILRLLFFYEGERRWAEAEPLQLRLLERARRLHGPEHGEVATQHNIIALFYARAGRDIEAEQNFQQALAMRERLYGAADLNTQQSIDNLFAFYRQRGREAEAVALAQRYREATAEAAALRPVIPQATLSAAEQERRQREAREQEEWLRAGLERNQLNTQVGQLLREGRVREAEPLAERAFRSAQAAGDSATLVPLENLVEVYLSLDRIAEAEPLARRAFEERQRSQLSGSRFWDRELLQAAYNLARILHAQGRVAEAEELYTRMGANAGSDVAFSGRALNERAALLLERGEYAQAEQFAETLMTAFASSPLVPGHEYEVAARTRAAALVELERYPEADPLLQAILNASERRAGGTHPDTLRATSALGLSYHYQGRYGEAAALFRRAATGSEQMLGREHPSTLTYLGNLTNALLLSAEPPGAALEPARLLVAGERGRRTTGSLAQAEEQVGVGAALSPFALFADAAWASAQAAPAQRADLRNDAFTALQDTLASAATRSIAEQAARRYADGRNEALGALVRERAERQDELAQLNERLNLLLIEDGAQDGAPSLAALRQQLDTARRRIAEIDARLRTEAPDYFTLIQPQAVGAQAAQALLSADEAILLVVPSGYGTHVMAVTRDGIAWHRSEWDSERIAAAVRRLRWDAGARVSGSDEELARLQAGRTATASPQFDRATAHALYRELVAPVLASLAGKSRLFIAAGGPLAGLPFSLLVSSAPEGADDSPAALRATRWFADEFQLAHIPSVQSLAILRGQATVRPADGAAFIGIGNPQLAAAGQSRRYGVRGGPVTARQVFARGRTRNGTPADLGQIRLMSSLPGTHEELRLVREALGAPPSSVIEAGQATEPAVRQVSFANARLVLFSTHGLTSEEAAGAGEPGLVLTPPPVPDTGVEDYAEIDPANDGYLAASEVTALRMDNADWVVLSACHTATGDDNANLSALARAFLYAGARNLLASHWPVSDEVAPLLITRTVAPEPGGLTRGAALQRAMRDIRNDERHPEWAHPFYWAPFVLIGDGGV